MSPRFLNIIPLFRYHPAYGDVILLTEQFHMWSPVWSLCYFTLRHADTYHEAVCQLRNSAGDATINQPINIIDWLLALQLLATCANGSVYVR